MRFNFEPLVCGGSCTQICGSTCQRMGTVSTIRQPMRRVPLRVIRSSDLLLLFECNALPHAANRHSAQPKMLAHNFQREGLFESARSRCCCSFAIVKVCGHDPASAVHDPNFWTGMLELGYSLDASLVCIALHNNDRRNSVSKSRSVKTSVSRSGSDREGRGWMALH